MNIQGLVFPRRYYTSRVGKKKKSLFPIAELFTPHWSSKVLCSLLSCWVAAQLSATGSLSSRWGHPALVPPEPGTRRPDMRLREPWAGLGWAGERDGTQGEVRSGRAGRERLQGGVSPGFRGLCVILEAQPHRRMLAAGPGTGTLRFLSRASSESRLLVKTLSRPLSQVPP